MSLIYIIITTSLCQTALFRLLKPPVSVLSETQFVETLAWKICSTSTRRLDGLLKRARARVSSPAMFTLRAGPER
jgi:hypothetical protein